MHTDPPKNHDMRNRRIRVCSSILKLRNAIRPQKSRCGDHTKHNRTNKIN